MAVLVGDFPGDAGKEPLARELVGCAQIFGRCR
jgi:hypothetical protein